MELIDQFKKNLGEFLNPLKPLLLGLSGGPDSMALFYLLLESKCLFAVAHINHNWREESSLEADHLKKIVEKEGVNFHLLTLNPNEMTGNLENACREKRLQFFNRLSQEFDYKAVILGHHFGDQVETVLKRLFEGAILPKLQGLKVISVMEGLTILRPFLTVKKKEIISWLDQKSIVSFQDSTNYDVKFMRARFREKIIPYLSSEFGKEIGEPLYRLGNQAFELNQYLEKNFASFKSEIVKGAFGSYLDFSSLNLDFEIKYLIRFFVEQEGFFLSYKLVDEITLLIKDNKANKSVFMMGKHIVIDRKKMFILSEKAKMNPAISFQLDTLNPGCFDFEKWEVTLKALDLNEDFNSVNDWQNVFKGFIRLKVTAGTYRLTNSKIKKLSDLWTNCKVPAFLRDLTFVVLKNEAVYYEPLTGLCQPLTISSENNFELTFKFKG